MSKEESGGKSITNNLMSYENNLKFLSCVCFKQKQKQVLRVL